MNRGLQNQSAKTKRQCSNQLMRHLFLLLSYFPWKYLVRSFLHKRKCKGRKSFATLRSWTHAAWKLAGPGRIATFQSIGVALLFQFAASHVPHLWSNHYCTGAHAECAIPLQLWEVENWLNQNLKRYLLRQISNMSIYTCSSSFLMRIHISC